MKVYERKPLSRRPNGISCATYIRRYAGANLVCDDICSVMVIQLKFEEMARMYGFSCEVWIEFYSELRYSMQTGLPERTPVHHDRGKYSFR